MSEVSMKSRIPQPPQSRNALVTVLRLYSLQSERQCSVFSADFCGEWLRNVKILHSVQQTQFFSKNARILRKAVVDTTDSLAESVSCRQPTAVPLRQKIPPAKREQKKEQKRAGSQRNQLQFLLQVGTCGRILSEKFTNMFRRLIPVIQLIKQFIFIDSGINVFVMLRLALAAMATSVAAVSASTFHFSVIFHFLRFFSLHQQSYDIFRYRPPKTAF